jgi:hypothetical protein
MESLPWRDIFEIAAFVLALVALGFAFKQFADAHKQTGELKGLVDKANDQKNQMGGMLGRLEVLSNSLPTRFIGTFPDVVEALTTFIGAAKSEIRILCDFAGYGSYSNPISFAPYFDTIRRRRVTEPKIKIEIAVYSRAAGNEALPLQFDKNKYDEIKASEEFKNFFKIFRDRYPAPPADFTSWDNQNWEIEDDYRRALQSVGVDLKVIEKSVPVFLWLRDNEELIVSFQSSVEFGDFTFRTSDTRFIEFFRKQIDNAWNCSKPYEPSGKGNKPLLASDRVTTADLAASVSR